MRSAIIIDKKPIDYGRLEPDFEAHQQTHFSCYISFLELLTEDYGEHYQVPFIVTRISQTRITFFHMNMCDSKVFPSPINIQAEGQLAV